MCVLQIAILICSSSHAQSNFQDNTSIDQGVNLERKSVENLAEDLCSVLINTNLDHQINIKDEMESILLAFKQIQDSDSNKSEKLASFWNTHNHKMTCKESGSSEKTQHIFKKSLHMKLHKPTLFDYFLHKENGFAVDVNYIG